jgi:hypothetical protein
LKLNSLLGEEDDAVAVVAGIFIGLPRAAAVETDVGVVAAVVVVGEVDGLYSTAAWRVGNFFFFRGEEADIFDGIVFLLCLQSGQYHNNYLHAAIIAATPDLHLLFIQVASRSWW